MKDFFILHNDLPREGPGDRSDLDWALGHVGLAPDATILDAACGPGADIEGLLAHAPDGHVTAFDKHAAFVEQARARYPGEPRLTVRSGDMTGDLGGPYDLIWCAGALYFMGVEPGLAAFAKALKPDGHVIFSEPMFFTDTPSEAAVAFWEGYETGTEARIRDAIARAGFETIAVRPVSEKGWENYYQPLEERIETLRSGADANLTQVLDENAKEAADWRALRHETGYGLFVIRR